LGEHLTAVHAGRGSLVLVGGEPGIGKSRLLRELNTRAQDARLLVLVGRASMTEGSPPYLPFIEALDGWVRSAPAEQLVGCVDTESANVALLVPSLRDRIPDLPPPDVGSALNERFRLFESVCTFLGTLAAASSSGLLLALDDLHWADTPTLLLLRHVAH